MFEEEIIDSERASVDSSVFVNYLDLTLAILDAQTEASEVARRKMLEWENSKESLDVDRLADLGRSCANTAIPVEDQVVGTLVWSGRAHDIDSSTVVKSAPRSC